MCLSGASEPETLRYSINWPSGLSLGEATLTSQQNGGGWSFEFALEAAVPGFAIADRFRSSATAGLCSLEFERNTQHGKRKSSEKTTFDNQALRARRVTTGGGGTTVYSIPACAHDALTYVFHARRELAQGRVPAAETIYYGGPYSVRAEFGGTQNIVVNEKREQADRLLVRLKGPASEHTIEAFFARDAARTPLVIRAPFALGTFSMELVR